MTTIVNYDPRISLRIFEKTNDLAAYFARLLAGRVSDMHENEFFSLVLAGGSTPRTVYEYLAANCREAINWERVKIFWGDERCVAPDNTESNYKMAKESFLDYLPIPGNNIFRIRGEADPDEESKRYSEIAGTLIQADKHAVTAAGPPLFDLIMLGLGEDGHTASIFPGRPELFETDQLFVPARNPYTGQRRITITGKAINNARLKVFLVTGAAKAKIVAQYLGKKKGWESLPVSNVLPAAGEIMFLLDNDAASGLG